MKLIANYKRCFKLYSVQLAVLIAFAGFLQGSILPMWQAQLTDAAYAALNSILAVILFAARLIKQDESND